MTLASTSSAGAEKALVAVTLGDPAGIGPEVVAKLLADTRTCVAGTPLLVGDQWLWEYGQKIAGVQPVTRTVSSIVEARNEQGSGVPLFMAVDSIKREQVVSGQAGKEGGASVLQVLTLCLGAAVAGEVDAICYAPLNKQAMRMARPQFEDELHFFADYLGIGSYVGELNTLGSLWASRISSHIPFRQAAEMVTLERIVNAGLLIHRYMVQADVQKPRIALAALNPHAGEGGACGREEIDIMVPAIRELIAKDVAVSGPIPADTVFIRARAGEFDGVITMYHDQGQIALKLMGFDRGVTVHGGLPAPVTTPAHGTAYDIAGQNKGEVGAMVQAYLLAARMGAQRYPRGLSEEIRAPECHG